MKPRTYYIFAKQTPDSFHLTAKPSNKPPKAYSLIGTHKSENILSAMNSYIPKDWLQPFQESIEKQNIPSNNKRGIP